MIDEDLHIVDKTLFVKEFMTHGDEVCTILRPRRFGKSTNLTMLKMFLSIGADPSKFAPFEIGKPEHKPFVEKHCGKYPVIYLDFRDCQGDTWELMSGEIIKSIKLAIYFHRNVLPENHPWGLKSMKSNSTKIQDFTRALFELTLTLREQHENKRVIFLIDEYDAPLNQAYRNGFYDDAAKFFGTFYFHGLKSNTNLKKACLAGIVEICGIGIFSSITNATIYSVKDKLFSTSFGFTREEIQKFLREENERNNTELNNVELDVDSVLKWYNGYTFGDLVSVINPLSFMTWYKRFKEFDTYWVDTSSIETVAAIIKKCDPITFCKLTGILTDEEPLKVRRFKWSVNYSRKWTLRSVTTFLILTGYLSYKIIEDQPNMIQIYIPNEELRIHWEDEIHGLFIGDSEVTDKQAETREFFLSDPFDFKRFEVYVKDFFFEQYSYFDFNYEANYHICLFTFFRTLFYRSKDVIPRSNRESGHGRYDLMIELPNLNRVICIELKRSVNEESLESDAKIALTQIDEMIYFADYPRYECIKIGVSFCSKIMSKFHYAISNPRKRKEL